MTRGMVRTERLRMEPLSGGHTSVVHAPLQDPHVYTYLPQDPPSLEALQRRYDFLEGGRSPDGQEQWLNWVAFERGTEKAVGTFQVTLTAGAPGAIAYIIFTSHQRSGYGRDGLGDVGSSLSHEPDTERIRRDRYPQSGIHSLG